MVLQRRLGRVRDDLRGLVHRLGDEGRAHGGGDDDLGLTCDPVAGYVQIPCIERCAYGAVKSWTGFMIASNEIPADRRVDFDTTVSAMALTAKEMNSKYKETSEGGLAVSVTLC